MIYLDTSVALAHLLSEDRRPPDSLWGENLVSSRLLAYELWTRIHAGRHSKTHGAAVRELLSRIAFMELTTIVLARAQEPFPLAVRTLDALHLASLEFLRSKGQAVALASYDERQLAVARRLHIDVARL